MITYFLQKQANMFQIVGSEKNTKIVEYFGNQYIIPSGATHIATDGNGTVNWYICDANFSPVVQDDGQWGFSIMDYNGTYDDIDKIEFTGDWKLSLVAI